MDPHSLALMVLASDAAARPISAVCRFAYCDPLRRAATTFLDRWLELKLATSPTRPSLLGDPESPSLRWERTMMARAVVHTLNRVVGERLISPHVLAIASNLWAQAILRSGANRSRGAFERTYGSRPPWFLVLSPGHDCNLHCSGCYADSGGSGTRLPWSTLDRIIAEAKALWGIPLVVFSGGEPLAYRSEGKGVLDIVQEHPDCLYLMFTNGTLVDEEVADRLERLGCVTPALSLEGMRDSTDRRRGRGTFNRIRRAMALLREAGVPFGVSLTATRSNCGEVLSDRFLDFCFSEQGAFYGFVFMYMPIGRTADVALMPTARQRLLLWRRTWEVIVRRRLFLFDFWNHASLVNGCLAAGRPGGYFHIDWNGRVMPCVFAPYAGADITEVFASDGNLNDVWQAPFFEAIRRWQRGHDVKHPSSVNAGNRLMPCPVRDHYSDFRSCVDRHRPEPEHEAARRMLGDDEYTLAMAAYGRELQLATSELCRHVYDNLSAARQADGVSPSPPARALAREMVALAQGEARSALGGTAGGGVDAG